MGDNEKLWKTFRIKCHGEAPRFPDNKIYAKIFIEPESARKLIAKFILIVNGSIRSEFSRDYREMSASGFDIKKENNQISVTIEAIPSNKSWETFHQKSEPCIFYFTNKIFGLNPTISYDWVQDKPDVIVAIKWYHLGDKCAQKYIVRLDGKDIQNINQSSIRHELKIRIEGFKAGEKHTMQVVAALKNGKETYRSDVKDFIVPKEKDEQNSEVINVTNEPLPPNLLAIIEVREDKKTKEVLLPPPPSPSPPPAHDEFRERALALLRTLERQIEEKKAG